ncbi:phosphatidylcholine/phosphatidylserine synthase [Gammaproteobacteria bacterium]|jgi:CDP-diacylglycerol---serine O-phosphatidyltransferase|nr:phosphatidylcholine/phosphatidylserine synthase [Gammaproteobacteria bacterium]MDA9249139.1 phosphatidylcholine/phosphatidylserine synthase [Gammaproteobacteria bacterium]MDA9258359.1 phosphatidylcholine/phosphatidylserine synthase [Gammaproteobacteria bacterium]MDA9785779.1 phosphatidylcholine/phosphatidylserine synthase [Gammaproteobacteria bacterium]MDB4194331.1 phosphatidylcholine/phosphatidylserine synthase [Gammaproteobacteria bacterium]
MKKIDFKVLLPNVITLSGLSFGLSSIRFALESDFNLAIVCILLAGVCDVLDGMLARHLQSESDLGAQLDSLSDFLSFGIAPGLLIYMSIFNQESSIGAFACLAFIIFSCLRLALYNVRLEASKSSDGAPEHFFTGIPTPVGAVLILLPLTHSFMGYNWAYENLSFVAGYIILISALLVSRIPTFSIKRKQFFVQSRLAFLVLFSVIALSIINFLWITMNILAMIYLITIPFSILAWQSNSK